MPALNFKKQFAQSVNLGTKRQTIRRYRKDGRDPKPGDKLYLYTGMRTKNCKRLLVAKCVCTCYIVINNKKNITLDGKPLNKSEIINLALKDGFDNLNDFISFFEKNHELPFCGLLICW